jgi:hypothetical protein
MCNAAAKLLFHIPYSDITNAFKAYRTEIISNAAISANGFEVFLELPIKAIKSARRTTEIEVEHFVRKKKLAKLSVIRDGYRYVLLLCSLLRTERVGRL